MLAMRSTPPCPSLRASIAAYLDAQQAAGDAGDKKASDAEAWKDQFFQWHPNADTNKDGKLCWPEYHAHKAKVDARKAARNKSNGGQ